jgi:DNA-3-methyladenine glycosylase
MLRLSRGFFARDTLAVARALLGQRLVRVLDGRRLAGRIVEVEAYVGETDQASHASCGPTRRNAPMYGPPGHAYVYLIYGMHNCLNVVTERDGYPAAILIRALEPLEGIDAMRARRGGRPDLPLTSGPARLCQALDVDRRFDGADLCAPGALLFLEAGVALPDATIATGPRVGVRGDEAALSARWRFYLRDNPHVSR